MELRPVVRPADGGWSSTAGDDELAQRLVPGSIIRPPDAGSTDLGIWILRPWDKSAKNWVHKPTLNLNGKSQGSPREIAGATYWRAGWGIYLTG